MNFITIIFPYRNRNSDFLRNSLESLRDQTDSKFEVFLIDYGSRAETAREVEQLCNSFSFVEYQYYPTQFQPWNKSRALNTVIKDLETDFCFVADVDMVFHPNFVKEVKHLQQKDTTVYFQVGFLGAQQDFKGLDFSDKSIRISTSEATGLSMFPVKALKKLRGFDEFYHFWGAEDTDIHIRLKNAGYPVEFNDEEILLLHQWHPSYRSREKNTLTTDLQVSNIVQLNHQHLNFAIENKITKVNPSAWGEIQSEKDLHELEKSDVTLQLTNEKREIDDFLYGQLPVMKDRILKVQVRKEPFESSLKYRVKKNMRKKVPQYYKLKEVNDRFLLHIISFYRNNPYTYKVSKDLDEIELAIKL